MNISHLEAARTALGQGELDTAEAEIQKAIEADGQNAVAHAYHAEILAARGSVGAAVKAYEIAVELQPENGVLWNGLGLTRFKAGQLVEAISALERAVSLLPEQAEVHNNLGNLLKERGSLVDAIEHYRQAIALKPDYGEAHGNLGVALMHQGKFSDARTSLEAAVGSRPQDPVILTNLGCVYGAMGALTEAISWHRKSLEQENTSLGALNNLAIALKDAGEFDEAKVIYEHLLTLKPDSAESHSNMLMGVHYREGISGANLLRIHREWSDRHEKADIRVFANSTDPDRRLRIGYVSPDFWTHSVANFIAAPLRFHGRADFHVSCYSDVLTPDHTTKMLRTQSDNWCDVRHMDDRALAEQIIGDEIDILVDLAGHTADNRLVLFGRRAAPVQMSWIGYPATTGLSQMDYRISDGVTDPPESSAGWHSETLQRLAECFLCYTPPENMPKIPERRDERPIVFGSFNNFSKVTPDLVRTWATLLSRVPDSRLLLKSRQLADPVIVEKLKIEFEEGGIDPARLTLMGRVDGRDSHLALYNEMDIALDTYPYNGTTTTCEALLMGVPVISRRGDLHAGRVGASLLGAFGRPDWVAGDNEEYLGIAESLVSDRPAKQSLRELFLQSAVTDGETFTRGLEQTYRTVWRAWCKSGVD